MDLLSVGRRAIAKFLNLSPAYSGDFCWGGGSGKGETLEEMPAWKSRSLWQTVEEDNTDLNEERYLLMFLIILTQDNNWHLQPLKWRDWVQFQVSAPCIFWGHYMQLHLPSCYLPSTIWCFFPWHKLLVRENISYFCSSSQHSIEAHFAIKTIRFGGM